MQFPYDFVFLGGGTGDLSTPSGTSGTRPSGKVSRIAQTVKGPQQKDKEASMQNELLKLHCLKNGGRSIVVKMCAPPARHKDNSLRKQCEQQVVASKRPPRKHMMASMSHSGAIWRKKAYTYGQ